MEQQPTVDARYPIGPFTRKDHYSADDINVMITTIEEAPERYTRIVNKLQPADLSKTYRPGSYNVQQLVHHVADIQMVHFFRMKKALTEPDYKEVTLINMDGWVLTPDSAAAPLEYSLEMLAGLTKRYVYLLRSLDEKDLAIAYYHPVRKYTINQAQAMAMSYWHLRHHLRHIEIAIGA